MMGISTSGMPQSPELARFIAWMAMNEPNPV